MALQYCNGCDKQIDLDYDVEHFEECTHQVYLTRDGKLVLETVRSRPINEDGDAEADRLRDLSMLKEGHESLHTI